MRFLPFFAIFTSVWATLQASLSSSPCDDLLVNVANQSSLASYTNCTTLPFDFGFAHTLSGPFLAPGIESIGRFVSGYLGPQIGKGDPRVDDGVTSVSMPDLRNTTDGYVLLSYLPNLTEISFPKLQTIAGELSIIANPLLRSVSLPALESVTHGAWIKGDITSISLPQLKTVGYLRIESTANIDCNGLSANFSSLAFTPTSLDVEEGYVGFSCYSGDGHNVVPPSATMSSSTASKTASKTSSPTGTGSSLAGTSTVGSGGAASGTSTVKSGAGDGLNINSWRISICVVVFVSFSML